MAQIGEDHHITSFADRSLASSVFLGSLLSAVQPGAVNTALLTPGESARDKELNAKYVISTARKLGCFLFLLWEDIVEVNPRMILVLIASIMAMDTKQAQSPQKHLIAALEDPIARNPSQQMW